MNQNLDILIQNYIMLFLRALIGFVSGVLYICITRLIYRVAIVFVFDYSLNDIFNNNVNCDDLLLPLPKIPDYEISYVPTHPEKIRPKIHMKGTESLSVLLPRDY